MSATKLNIACGTTGTMPFLRLCPRTSSIRAGNVHLRSFRMPDNGPKGGADEPAHQCFLKRDRYCLCLLGPDASEGPQLELFCDPRPAAMDESFHDKNTPPFSYSEFTPVIPRRKRKNETQQVRPPLSVLLQRTRDEMTNDIWFSQCQS